MESWSNGAVGGCKIYDVRCNSSGYSFPGFLASSLIADREPLPDSRPRNDTRGGG
jgi:hypothetical protein